MANGMTNKGRYKLLGYTFRATALPTNFYMALVTSAAAPSDDTNTFTELTEIAGGNGYTTGGYQLTPGATDFDVWTEDDDNDMAYIQLKDITWTASGGNLPASGNGARYAVLIDDNATVANREIHAWWDLSSDRVVSDTQDLTLQDAEIRLSKAT